MSQILKLHPADETMKETAPHPLHSMGRIRQQGVNGQIVAPFGKKKKRDNGSLNFKPVI